MEEKSAPQKPQGPDPLRKMFLAMSGIVGALAIGIVALVILDPGESTGGPDRGGLVTGSSLGGVVALTGTDGQPLSTQQFDDRYQMVYFGYTFCPDICPNALYEMSVALEQLGPAAEQIQPIFITVDPKRDTPELLAEYMAAFHDSFIALSGTQNEVDQAAKTYLAGYSFPEGQDDPYYTVNHTALIYVMGPGHTLLTTFNHQTTAAGMVQVLRGILEPGSP